MRVIADFHIHSKYSRGTSKNLDLKSIEYYAHLKGLNLMGTGDSTHPIWLNTLKKELREVNDGIYIRKDKKHDVFFMITTEINISFEYQGKSKRIHHLLLFPSIEVAEEFNNYFSKSFDLSSDGRPTFRMTAKEFVERTIKDINEEIIIIPAHVWTPWFSLFGSKSGFDSIDECYGDAVKYIYALETGLSSDPLMNWMVSRLDEFILVSNSDSHSYWPYRIGREANIFYLDTLSYKEIYKILKERKKEKIETIEVEPSYGKYHYDGHRKCEIWLHPRDSIKLGNICPVCGKKLTLGVLHRVYDLADREEGFKPEDAQNFYYTLPLQEIISLYLNKDPLSKEVWDLYTKFVNKFGNELNILIFEDINEIKEYYKELGDIIEKIRSNTLKIRPGYDGVYGKIILNESESIEPKFEIKQRSLHEFFKP